MEQSQTADLQALRQVVEAISGQLELAPLLTLIVREACQLLGAQRGTIGLVDAARNVVRTAAAYQMPPDELGSELAPGVGLAGTVYSTQQPLLLNRYGDLEQPARADLVEDAVVGVPILWHGKMIGFFGIGAPPPRRFQEHDVEMLTLFARHAAIAIDNARLFERMQQTLDEMQLLYATSAHISAAMDIDQVVAAYLEQVATRARYTSSVALYEFAADGARRAVIVHGHWSPEEGLVIARERLPYTRDALDPLLDDGLTVTLRDVHADPRASDELRRIQTESKRPAVAMIPLIVRGQRLGLVILSYPSICDWSDADLRPYQATAAQLATAIDSRRQYRLLQDREQEVAILEERQRLARELHDSVTQLIFSVTLVAQSLAPAYSRSAADGERRAQRVLDLSQKALAEMRTLLAQMRPLEAGPAPVPAGPAWVEREGLVNALRSHLADLAPEGLRIEFEAEGYAPQSFEREIALYRIAQEALHNVVKHAHAQRVAVRLRADPAAARLTVTDDGVGISSEAKDARGGLGLQTMRERAEAFGGSVRVVSAPRGGTTVEVTIPS